MDDVLAIAGLYAERPARPVSLAAERNPPGFRFPNPSRGLPARTFVRWVHEHRLEFASASGVTSESRLRALLRGATVRRRHLALAVARSCEAAQQSVGLDPNERQIEAAWHMLAGRLVEMETGEGKTLVAAIVASVHAMAGRPVHVVTTNDYLAERDATALRPMFVSLGLSSACVLGSHDDELRRAGYATDIVHVTAKHLMFDYLRDRLALGSRAGGPLRRELAARRAGAGLGVPLMLRGLHVAIVDEADAIFIDDAAIPLVISHAVSADEQGDIAASAMRQARILAAGTDFIHDEARRSVTLTEAGRAHLASLAAMSGPVFASRLWREHYVSQALAALHLFARDRDYILRGDSIEIVDGGTGRAMADRSWERGLHQMIQAKEGVAVTAPSEAMTRITHQAFFRRYMQLCGMSGTLREAAAEIERVYGVKTQRIATNRPLRRRDCGTRVFATPERKLAELVRRVAQLQGMGRPVLVGARTVADSERIAAALAKAGVSHRLLNARSEAEEAAIIAEAGQRGRVTVSTAMAGRGTDIRLGEGVAALGGMHVIATERHDSRRTDRQLFGRAARQGDPGSYEEMLSLQDEIVARYPSRLLVALARLLPLAWVRTAVVALSQRRAERRQRSIRAALCRVEDVAARALAVTGRIE